jgi:hypothetical protein
VRPAEEAATAAVAGGALGAVAGGLVGRLLDAPIGLAVGGAAVAAVNGALCGRRRIYPWRSAAGVGAFVLDSTWALLTTVAGVTAHVVGLVQGERAGYEPTLSERQGRVVYRRGLVVRPRFAITLGNVVNGARDVERPRRRRLITDHEAVHVWQARVLGPLYPLVYGIWMLVGALAGVAVWTVRRPRSPLSKTVETCSYYANPLEWWAYSRGGDWPPHAAVDGLTWHRPMCRPLEEVRSIRAERAARRAQR